MMKYKKIIILLIILSALVFLIFKYLTQDVYKNTIMILTSDNYKGRLVGDQGNDKTVIYMECKFKKMGLQYYTKNSYLHKFTIDIFNPEDSSANLYAKLKDGNLLDCVYGKDYIVQNKLNTSYINFPATFDINDLDLENKIIILENPGDINRIKDRVKGILVKKTLFTNKVQLSTLGIPIFQISDDLYKKLRNNEIECISMKTNFVPKKINASNVVGIIPGEDSSKAIIISAHFDHVGYTGEIIFRGAADNASGCEALLEVANKLNIESKKKKLTQDIVICAFNGEEFGRIGSKALVSELSERYKKLYNINIDTLGMKVSDKILLEGDDHFNNKLKSDLSIYFSQKGIKTDTKSKGYMSDNLSFEEQNICAINICSIDDNLIHTDGDSIEILNMNFIKKVSEAIIQFVITKGSVIYESDLPNKNNVSNSKGMTSEEANEFVKFCENNMGLLSYNEFKIVKFKGSDVVLQGSNKAMDFSTLKMYYPNTEMPTKMNELTFNNIKFSLMSNDLYKSFLNLDVENQFYNTHYERDISKQYIKSAIITYKDISKMLKIAMIREHTNTLDDKKFNTSLYYKSDIGDGSFFVKKSQKNISLIKTIKTDSDNFLVEIILTNISGNKPEMYTENEIYENQKDVDIEGLIRTIFYN